VVPYFTIEDPRSDDTRAVLSAHLAFTSAVTPSEGVFALDVNALLDTEVTLFGARQGGILLGVGAIKRLAGMEAELKSMHTLTEFRGQGVATSMVERLILEARRQGCKKLLLETGSMEAFAPARALYVKCGFMPCDRFGEYAASTTSVCMSMDLGAPVDETSTAD
jgi:putative acetyltransferase